MDQRLSTMIDAALRWHSEREKPSAEDIDRCWPALADLLRELGIFAREAERAESLNRNNDDWRRLALSLAAERLYERLLDPPYAANVVPLPTGVGRVLLLEAKRTS